MDIQALKTSGETLRELNAVVFFALEWIATHPVTTFDFAEGHKVAGSSIRRRLIERGYTDAIQGYAKRLAKDPSYVGEIVGNFVVRQRQEKGGIDAATWGQT